MENGAQLTLGNNAEESGEVYKHKNSILDIMCVDGGGGREWGWEVEGGGRVCWNDASEMRVKLGFSLTLVRSLTKQFIIIYTHLKQ